MGNLAKFIHTVCTVKKKKVLDYDLQGFLDKKLPIFWVIGPHSCGKTTLAEMLAKSSNYRLVIMDDLLHEELGRGRSRSRIISECINKNRHIPGDIVINLLKEEFMNTYENSVGYIIDGFPNRLSEAKLFEKKICKVNLIIYVFLLLDGMLARKVTQIGPFDPNEERIKYVREIKRLKNIAKKYDQKAIKISANYPPEDTCTRLVENLEDFWGYKFLRLYNKNQ